MTAEIAVLTLVSGILPLVFAGRVWRFFRVGRQAPANPIPFFLLIFLSLLALRLPFIQLPRELQVDESQMLAQGMRFVSHPVPWRDVDGTTSGPLNSMILSVPIRLGMPATWATARLVHFVLVCGTLLLTYLTFRLFGTRLEAQLAVFPAVFYYAFAVYPDFAHYSSESLPVLLLTASFYLLFKEWVSKDDSPARLFCLGFLLGTVPFAKLQAAPLALLLAAAALALIAFRHFRPPRQSGNWWLGAGALVSGGVLVPLLLLAIVAANGAFHDFWVSYILANASYVQEETMSKRLTSAWLLLCAPSDFNPYLSNAIGALLALLVFRFVRKTKLGFQLTVPLSLIAGYCVLALLCVVLAGKCFSHHFQLLVPALALCFGVLVFNRAAGNEVAVSSGKPDLRSRGNRWFWLCSILLLGFQLCKWPQCLQIMGRNLRYSSSPTHSFVAERVLEVSRPDDTMSVWGWVPSYYVETGLVPATRDAIGQRVISPGPYQAYFRQRYLADFERSRPAIFVDAIGQGIADWGWTAKDRHESYPALADVIARDYVLWRTVPFAAAASVRIYVSKSRMAQLPPSPPGEATPPGSRR